MKKKVNKKEEGSGFRSVKEILREVMTSDDGRFIKYPSIRIGTYNEAQDERLHKKLTHECIDLIWKSVTASTWSEEFRKLLEDCEVVGREDGDPSGEAAFIVDYIYIVTHEETGTEELYADVSVDTETAAGKRLDEYLQGMKKDEQRHKIPNVEFKVDVKTKVGFFNSNKSFDLRCKMIGITYKYLGHDTVPTQVAPDPVKVER